MMLRFIPLATLRRVFHHLNFQFSKPDVYVRNVSKQPSWLNWCVRAIFGLSPHFLQSILLGFAVKFLSSLESKSFSCIYSSVSTFNNASNLDRALGLLEDMWRISDIEKFDLCTTPVWGAFSFNAWLGVLYLSIISKKTHSSVCKKKHQYYYIDGQCNCYYAMLIK